MDKLFEIKLVIACAAVVLATLISVVAIVLRVH